MGAGESMWGVEALDGDSAWSFVTQLVSRPEAERSGILIDAMAAAVEDGGYLFVDDATAALTAAFFVALSRSPRTMPDQRRELLDHVSSTHDVHGIETLVGDLAAMRTKHVADLALRAIDGGMIKLRYVALRPSPPRYGRQERSAHARAGRSRPSESRRLGITAQLVGRPPVEPADRGRDRVSHV